MLFWSTNIVIHEISSINYYALYSFIVLGIWFPITNSLSDIAYIVIRGVYKKHVVTIVDEAHLLDKETLEEIRFLLNTKMDSFQPMSLILVGQNELWDKLKLQRYAAIRQRIDIKCEIPQYDRAQTEEYIIAHLAYADGNKEIFTEKALDEIYKYSAGSSRAINKLCTHALFFAAQRAKKLIDDHMIRTVIAGELP